MTTLAAAAPSELRREQLERLFTVPMLAVTLLVIPVVVIEASDVEQTWKTLAAVANWIIWGAFTLELVTMLAITPQRRAWLRTHPFEIAIVMLTPPFLPATLGALRLFRLARLLRVVIVIKRLKALATVEGVKFAAAVAAVAALGGGAIFASVEPGQHTVWDGAWWAVTTMATVGYGDLSPQTVIGRSVAIVLMFIGIGFFALVTGAVAQRFVDSEVRSVEQAENEFANLAATHRELVGELRELSKRLQEIERRLVSPEAQRVRS